MRLTYAIALAALVIPAAASAQDATRNVAGGGISVPGWQGAIDASEAAKGQKLTDAKLFPAGTGMHVVTGPAVAYWNPANKASGNYTVKATFTEPKFMGLNDHPHPYGIVIGGNDLGTDRQTYLYCAAYGTGKFIMRGFGPAPFKLNAGGEANPAISKASGPNSPVTQEIAVTVAGDKVSCAVNGTVVGTYDKAQIVGEGKLKSTDGVYGIRLGHNTEAHVEGLSLTKK